MYRYPKLGRYGLQASWLIEALKSYPKLGMYGVGATRLIEAIIYSAELSQAWATWLIGAQAWDLCYI